MASSKEIKLRSNFKKILIKFFDLFGYEIKRINNFNDRYKDFIVEADIDKKKDLKYFSKICLASELNLWSIRQSLEYLYNKDIEGDIVECGVYNGNTLSYIGKNCEEINLKRKIWGYDTFDGFVKDSYSQHDREFKTNKQIKYNEPDSNIFYTLDQVKKNILKNDLINFDKYNLIKGDILKILDEEKKVPKQISFLRLDTDIYKTTKKQLEILYPRLSKGGVLHIDDYGLCPGVKKAVDEYFSNEKIWLHRVDITCRYLIKN